MLVSKDSKNNYRKYKTKKSTKKQTVGREFSALEKLSVISNKIIKKRAGTSQQLLVNRDSNNNLVEYQANNQTNCGPGLPSTDLTTNT